MTMSTLFVSSSDTVASDSGVYTCQAILTVNETDMFTYSDVTHITLKGKYTWLSVYDYDTLRLLLILSA